MIVFLDWFDKGFGFLDWFDKGFIYMWEEFWKVHLLMSQPVQCGWQDIKIHLLTDRNCFPNSHDSDTWGGGGGITYTS